MQNGNKNSFERKVYQDYRAIPNLNNVKIPHRILVELENVYGDTFYQENRDKVEINTIFSNRIFMKEVYAGGFN